MRHVLKTLAASLLIGMFLSTTATAVPNDNANDAAFSGADNAKNSAPEINPVAASAVGILLVGGIALLTARRRPQSA